MSKFRIKWARSQGEAKAREFEFSKFPIDPFAIAQAEDILVEPKPEAASGVSGGIIFHDDNVGIFYATNIKSEGFQNFTVGHELGHYFLEGHPEEILSTSPMHLSRAGFSQGQSSIEIEADHFASGLLMPTKLVKAELLNNRIGLEGILALADEARCSRTASAIRAAECSQYPMAIVVSEGNTIRYGFLSDGFKRLGKLNFPRKGDPLPASLTNEFNQDTSKVLNRAQACGTTSLANWFDGPEGIELDEEVLGLGKYGYTLTVLSSEKLPEDPDEFEDEDAKLIQSWTPKFAYGR